jgi:hypothetical protein
MIGLTLRNLLRQPANNADIHLHTARVVVK